MIQPPSIPTQFARPVPQITTPAPADVLNRPGPYGAQPQSAPRVGPPTALPPGAAIPAAGSAVAGAGSGIILPALVLAVPLAIAGGEVGNPIMGTAKELEAIRRADRAKGQEKSGLDRPGSGSDSNVNPNNPRGGNKKPTFQPRPRPPSGPGIEYRISYYTQWSGVGAYRSDLISQTILSPYGGVTTRLSPFAEGATDIGFITGRGFVNAIRVGTPDASKWSIQLVSIAPLNSPPSPSNPGSGGAPIGTMAPISNLPPNPTQPARPPNPTNPNPTQPTLPGQPTNPNPTNPNPTLPGQPTNPTNPNQPTQPTNPNPTQPGQPTNPTQPTNPNPTNPNPTQPTLPGQPTNPTNPTNPNPVNPAPRAPGPLVPVSPGPLVPVSPGPLVPKPPIPNGPSNPKRDPCGDPCIDTALSRTEPVVIQVKQFVSCTRSVFGIPAPYNTVPVTVPRLFAPAFQLVLDNQAELLKQISCNPPEPSIAAIPDWWQIRLGANRPQLLVLYARKFSDGVWDKPKYVLSIPHWNKTKLQTVLGDFPIYDKGDFQGTRVLPDNSKLIVNALSSVEALRVLNKLSLSIPAEMLQQAQTSVSDRRGAPLRKITVYPRIVRYFATGQKDLSPTWSIDFR